MTTESSAQPVDRSADQRSLAASLVPALQETCGGRLGEITWFKADWQRGGAATGSAVYTDERGIGHPVVLKLPVVRRELSWITRLQSPDDDDPVVPRLFACGDTIGGYDLTWLVMERFAHGPLGLRWSDGHVPRIADAIARFHAEAARFPVDQPPRREPWEDMLRTALENVRLNQLPDAREWTAAIKRVLARLDELQDAWRARNVSSWLHGDAHLANAMSRHALNDGTVSLIDLAEVHAGHWVEDAVYFERQLWARPGRMKKHKPVKAVAAARRRRGLPVEPDDTRLANVRRVLLAATAPYFIKSEGHPKHLEACLAWVDKGLAIC